MRYDNKVHLCVCTRNPAKQQPYITRSALGLRDQILGNFMKEFQIFLKIVRIFETVAQSLINKKTGSVSLLLRSWGIFKKSPVPGPTLGENKAVFSISELKYPTMVIFAHVGYFLMKFWNFEKKNFFMK